MLTKIERNVLVLCCHLTSNFGIGTRFVGCGYGKLGSLFGLRFSVYNRQVALNSIFVKRVVLFD
jgi:hypothetical protein